MHKGFSDTASRAAHSANLFLGEESLVTTQWLLNNLTVLLQHHLSYACLIKKHGTILYRTNGDLLVSLSHSLHAAKEVTNTKGTLQDTRIFDTNNIIIVWPQTDTEISGYRLRTPSPFDQVELDKLVSMISRVYKANLDYV